MMIMLRYKFSASEKGSRVEQNLEGLGPISWVLGALDDLNLCREGDLAANLQTCDKGKLSLSKSR